jgi:hypothetical protein
MAMSEITNWRKAYRLIQLDEEERLAQAEQDRLVVEALRNSFKHPHFIAVAMIWIGERLTHLGVMIQLHYGATASYRM